MDTINRFETEARQRKVHALLGAAAKAYDGRGFSADDLEAFTDEQWTMLAEIANVHPPSPASVSLVLSSLRVRERDVERAPDPFVGLS